MVDQSVVDYIRKHRNEHGIEALRKALIENGHREEDVEEAIRVSNGAEPPKQGGSSKKLLIVLVVCIAIFILIVIGMPLISLFWLSSYMEGVGGADFQITDAYCTGGQTGVVVIENLGNSPIDTSRIEILDALQANSKLSPGSDFTWDDSTIGAGGTGTVRIDAGECGTERCRYRLMLSPGMPHTADIVC